MNTTSVLNQLDDQIEQALATGHEDSLPILGYGEINPVLQWSGANGPIAVKRLPIFDSAIRLEKYRNQFDEFVTTLRNRGIEVIESRLEVIKRVDGNQVVYCIQPALARAVLLPEVIRYADHAKRIEIFSLLSDALISAISPQLGLDAQVSNWGLADGKLTYLDVTTPMLRDASEKDRLDTDLFVASFPAISRSFIRNFLLRRILNPYFSSRTAALDLIGNLHKERLGFAIPLAVEIFNDRLTTDLSIDEVRHNYRREARLWGFGQWIRRCDRTWQRRVRRRSYPFLLPGRVPR